jgi:hypothetical protein
VGVHSRASDPSKPYPPQRSKRGAGPRRAGIGSAFCHPIDGRIVLRDGHPLLGRSKTWHGVAAAFLLAACAAVLMSLPWQLGALAAASAMAGDCLSSFVKRRFGLEPSSMTLGLD